MIKKIVKPVLNMRTRTWSHTHSPSHIDSQARPSKWNKKKVCIAWNHNYQDTARHTHTHIKWNIYHIIICAVNAMSFLFGHTFCAFTLSVDVCSRSKGLWISKWKCGHWQFNKRPFVIRKIWLVLSSLENRRWWLFHFIVAITIANRFVLRNLNQFVFVFFVFF